MTCRELVELVTDYLDGAMSQSERARFEEHLDMCEGCREHLDQVRTTLTVLDVMPETEAEAGDVPGMDKLLDAFRDFRRG